MDHAKHLRKRLLLLLKVSLSIEKNMAGQEGEAVPQEHFRWKKKDELQRRGGGHLCLEGEKMPFRLGGKKGCAEAYGGKVLQKGGNRGVSEVHQMIIRSYQL